MFSKLFRVFLSFCLFIPGILLCDSFRFVATCYLNLSWNFSVLRNKIPSFLRTKVFYTCLFENRKNAHLVENLSVNKKKIIFSSWNSICLPLVIAWVQKRALSSEAICPSYLIFTYLHIIFDIIFLKIAELHFVRLNLGDTNQCHFDNTIQTKQRLCNHCTEIIIFFFNIKFANDSIIFNLDLAVPFKIVVIAKPEFGNLKIGNIKIIWHTAYGYFKNIWRKKNQKTTPSFHGFSKNIRKNYLVVWACNWSTPNHLHKSSRKYSGTDYDGYRQFSNWQNMNWVSRASPTAHYSTINYTYRDATTSNPVPDRATSHWCICPARNHWSLYEWKYISKLETPPEAVTSEW